MLILKKERLKVFKLALLIFFFSLVDGLFTIYAIKRGILELNPIMNIYLSYGYFTFITVKLLFTGISLGILVTYHTCNYILPIIKIFLVVYSILTGYHIWYFFNLH